MTAKSSVKSATRVEQGRKAIAAMERDPATGRIRKKGPPAQPPGGSLADQTGIEPAGGGAAAPAPPTHGFLARHRRRSAS